MKILERILKAAIGLILAAAIVLAVVGFNVFGGASSAYRSFTDGDAEILAKMVWGEARGLSQDEWRLTIWTVLQRVEVEGRYGDTIEAVVTAHRQFVGYRSRNPVCSVILAVVIEELEKWVLGYDPPTLKPFAPTFPYLYFELGDDGHNHFRAEWRP